MGRKNTTTNTTAAVSTSKDTTTNTTTEELTPEVRSALEERRAALLAELNAIEGRLARKQLHNLWTSQVEGPVALCRRVFVGMYADVLGGTKTRADYLRIMTNHGVARNTAQTQWQVNRNRWAAGELDEMFEQLMEEAEG